MRLIDANRLCEDLMKRWDIADERNEWMVKGVMSNIVTPIIASQPTINPWIPVSSYLPLPMSNVIVSVHDDSGDGAFDYIGWGWMTHDNRIWVVDNEENSMVSAWMPLPKPYEEGNNEVE